MIHHSAQSIHEGLVFACLVIFACLGLSFDLSAKDLVVKEGETVQLSGQHAYGLLDLQGGSTLVLHGRVGIECDRFSLGGKIILSGDTEIRVKHLLLNPNSKAWAMRVLPNQAPYPNNFQPQIVPDYAYRAADGASGNPGHAGDPGVTGYKLELVVHGDLQIDGTKETATRFTINLDGQHGGRGGNASGGGKGGDSGPGGGGGHLKVTVTDKIVANPWGWFYWSANGGYAGGSSGNDADETTGGGGGNGTQGGNGGLIEIQADGIDPYIGARLSANGGGSGGGGCAFDHDPPGKGAPGGNGGRIKLRVRGDLKPGARWELYAKGGYGTGAGDCSCASCYWWNTACVCNQVHNRTGQGGKGGRVSVVAADIDNLSLYATGGAGGNGLSGHNMQCSYDSVNMTCNWGSFNGAQVGDGGDAASGGSGGILTLISRTGSVGADVSYALEGGAAGSGGRGGRPSCPGHLPTCCTVCPSGTNGADGAPGPNGGFGVKRQGGTLLGIPLLFSP